jgi:hypothetical protein
LEVNQIYIDDEPFAVVNLFDTKMVQVIDPGVLVSFLKERQVTMKFEILEVYPGTKYEDTACEMALP